MRARRWAAALVLACGCSAITHAYDFQTEPPPSNALCATCTRKDARRVPCPPVTDDPGPDSTSFYVMQSMDLGATAATWASDAYGAGLDQDCAGGAAPSCGAPPATPFVALPHGIENAFATRVLAPITTSSVLGSPGRSFDPGAWLRSGGGGSMIVVEHWNGAPDDASVRVLFVSVVGPAAGGTPRFAEDERWNVFAVSADPNDPAVPLVSSATTDAYVSGGQLVADFRDAGEVDVTFGDAEVVVAMPVFGMVLTGQISAGAISPATLAGEIQSGGQRTDFEHSLSDLVLGCCAPGLATARTDLTTLMNESEDLLVDGVCAATSVGLSFDARRVGGIGVAGPEKPAPPCSQCP